MYLKFFLLLNLFLSVQFVLAQPDIRFNPFDWNLYGKPSSINSISFGDRYAFIGTSGAGALRFNINSNRFEEPITVAQGLSSNFVTAVHYSKNGMIWVATLKTCNLASQVMVTGDVFLWNQLVYLGIIL